MGSMRRRTSVDCVAAEAGRVPEGCAAEAAAAGFEAEVGHCCLSWSPGCGSGRLEIRPSMGRHQRFPGGLVSHLRAEDRSSEAHALAAALRRVLAAGVDFVAVCDLRRGAAPAELAEALAAVADAEATWASRLKSVALLVRDSLFSAKVADATAAFLEGARLQCPLLVCHAEASSRAFFAPATKAAAQGDDGESPFVSLIHVRALTSARRRPDAGVHSLATLAPAGARGRKPASLSEAHTFHVLPNGDVRVIQSPPRSIMRISSGDGAANADEGCAGEHVTVSESGNLVCAVAETSAVVTLRFNCAQESLERLKGVHFHIGELVVDAEAASRHGPMSEDVEVLKEQAQVAAREQAKPAARPFKMGSAASWCLLGVRFFARGIVAALGRGYAALLKGLTTRRLPPPCGYAELRSH